MKTKKNRYTKPSKPNRTNADILQQSDPKTMVSIAPNMYYKFHKEIKNTPTKKPQVTKASYRKIKIPYQQKNM
jgi:hypothetical protein